MDNARSPLSELRAHLFPPSPVHMGTAPPYLVLSHTLPVQGILEMEKSKEKGDGWVPFQFPWEEHLLCDACISSFLSLSVSLRSKAFHLPREHCNRARIRPEFSCGEEYDLTRKNLPPFLPFFVKIPELEAEKMKKKKLWTSKPSGVQTK